MFINKCLTDKEVVIKAINNKLFKGKIVDIKGKADNDETNRDSLTLYDGKDYIFFSDNEIKAIEVIDE